MKRLFTLMAIMTLSIASLMAQTPDLINYQAVARDGNGDIMANQSINVTFIIHSGSAAGPVEFEEDHNSVTTNDFGLFSLQIGSGTNVSGSISAIDWGGDSHWLEVEVNGASISTQQLVSVPYALEAGAPWVRNGSDLVYTEGNVGIGVSSPSYTLDISSSNTNRALNIVNTATGTIGQLINIERTNAPSAGNDFFQLKVPTGSPDNFQFMECERGTTVEFSIQGDGSVGIHTGSTSADLHIKQSSGSPSGTAGIRHEYNGSTDYWQTGIASTDNYWMVFNGSLAAFVTTAGVFTTSDARLKTDAIELPSVLEKVGQIKPLTYRYINGTTNEPTIGVFAQELQAVYPELVRDEEGTLGVNYPALSVVAIKAIQEQQAQMETMQAEMDALKQELKELKK